MEEYKRVSSEEIEQILAEKFPGFRCGQAKPAPVWLYGEGVSLAGPDELTAEEKLSLERYCQTSGKSAIIRKMAEEKGIPFIDAKLTEEEIDWVETHELLHKMFAAKRARDEVFAARRARDDKRDLHTVCPNQEMNAAVMGKLYEFKVGDLVSIDGGRGQCRVCKVLMDGTYLLRTSKTDILLAEPFKGDRLTLVKE